MPNRPWTNADNVKLRSLAGKIPTKEIAAQLGRSLGATVVQASKLKLSLNRRQHTKVVNDPGAAGFGASITSVENPV